MQNLVNYGVYFANVPLTKTTNEPRCEILIVIINVVLIVSQNQLLFEHKLLIKCLIIPIIKISVELHEQNLGIISDNLALINVKKPSNNAILSFLEDNVCYYNSNRIT